jgi:urease accessory protein
MRTELHLEAHKGRSPRIRAIGGLAVRQTGANVLHMISSAATPLGGDHIDIYVDVGSGAELTLRSVAAAIALPGLSDTRSEMFWHITVADGARLIVDPQPTVVAANADHATDCTVNVAGSGEIRFCERVQVGRTGEHEGRWSGRMHVDVAGTVALRHQLRLGTPDHDDLGAPSVLLSEFRYPDSRDDAVHSTAVAARLGLAAGGSLTTVLAGSLSRADQLAGELVG